MSKRKKPRMCVVTWLDASFDIDSHWSDGSLPPKPKAGNHLCLSVGWLTHMDDHFVQLVQTLTDGQHANVANIPRGMVREIHVLGPTGSL